MATAKKVSAKPEHLDVKLRAWWSMRQGLDGSLAKRSAGEVLARSGWARSVGGVGPYLTLYSRAGIGREAADAAVAKLEIHELPAARGCTYVVPAADYALALRVGQPFAGGEMRTAEKLGVTEKEIAKLDNAVVAALAKTPLAPDAIRDAVGAKARSLGEEGKKRGLTTTLPISLGRLQSTGAIRRVPDNGRLDQQRYRYTVWSPNPLAKDKRSVEDAQRDLARSFFRWIGPARISEFQWFSGLGVKATKDIVAPLGLVPIADGSDFVLLPEDLKAWQDFEPPAKPHYVLVSSLDSIAAARREISALLDPADRARTIKVEQKSGALASFSDLPSHAIVDRGRIVGLWEMDLDAGRIVHAAFVKDKALAAAVAATEAYVRDELGDARSFSLDSPQSRKPRIAQLRALA
jgi:hypothetical protein